MTALCQVTTLILDVHIEAEYVHYETCGQVVCYSLTGMTQHTKQAGERQDVLPNVSDENTTQFKVVVVT